MGYSTIERSEIEATKDEERNARRANHDLLNAESAGRADRVDRGARVDGG